MFFRFMADSVLIVHLCFVLFIVFGGLIALRSRKVLFLHVPAVIWGFLVQWNQWICPLTPLENWFRELGGEAGYESGFIDHYVLPILYIDAGRWLHVTLAIAAVTLNVIVYIFVYRKWTTTGKIKPA